MIWGEEDHCMTLQTADYIKSLNLFAPLITYFAGSLGTDDHSCQMLTLFDL